MLEPEHGDHALQLLLLIGSRKGHLKQVLVTAQQVLLHDLLIMAQHRREHHAEHQQQVGKQHAHQQHGITAQVLGDHPQAEPAEKRHSGAEGNRSPLLFAAQVPPQELQR